MSETTTATSWWTPGNRKLIIVGACVVGFVAVIITWMITQPAGVTLDDLATRVGGVLSALAGLFSTANLVEHKLKGG